MSTPRELRERFQKEPDDKSSGSPSGIQVNVSEILGITAQDMKDTIIADIEAMIEKNYRPALEGYILCLSRIINHSTAWECIVEAFHSKNENVPGKYYNQFGKKPGDAPPKKGVSVQ